MSNDLISLLIYLAILLGVTIVSTLVLMAIATILAKLTFPIFEKYYLKD
jgi:Tfp pilus assembly major pilin PilA